MLCAIYSTGPYLPWPTEVTVTRTERTEGIGIEETADEEMTVIPGGTLAEKENHRGQAVVEVTV